MGIICMIVFPLQCKLALIKIIICYCSLGWFPIYIINRKMKKVGQLSQDLLVGYHDLASPALFSVRTRHPAESVG